MHILRDFSFFPPTYPQLYQLHDSIEIKQSSVVLTLSELVFYWGHLEKAVCELQFAKQFVNLIRSVGKALIKVLPQTCETNIKATNLHT